MAILEFLLVPNRAEAMIALLLATAVLQLTLVFVYFGRTRCNAALEGLFARHPAIRACLYSFSSLLFAGIAMNLAVMIQNGGRMPVVQIFDDAHETTFDDRHRLLTPESQLPLLADVFVLEGERWIFLFSIGDILIFTSGTCLALFLLLVFVPSVSVAVGAQHRFFP